MPLNISDTKKSIFDKINEIPILKTISSNPLVLSIILVIVIFLIYYVQTHDVEGDISITKKAKILIYSYLTCLVILFINNNTILYEYRSDNQQDDIFTNMNSSDAPEIIQSNIYNGGGTLDLHDINKLDIDDFLKKHS